MEGGGCFLHVDSNTITMPKFYHSADDCDPDPDSIPFSFPSICFQFSSDQFNSVQLRSQSSSSSVSSSSSCMTMLLIYNHYYHFLLFCIILILIISFEMGFIYSSFHSFCLSQVVTYFFHICVGVLLILRKCGCCELKIS